MKRILIILLCGLLLTTTACNTPEPPVENVPTQSSSISTQPTDAPTELPDDTPIDTPTDLPTDTPTDTPTESPTSSESTSPSDATETPNEPNIDHWQGEHYSYLRNFDANETSYQIFDNDGNVVLSGFVKGDVFVTENYKLVKLFIWPNDKSEPSGTIFYDVETNTLTPFVSREFVVHFKSKRTFYIEKDEDGTNYAVISHAIHQDVIYQRVPVTYYNYIASPEFSHDGLSVTFRSYADENAGKFSIYTVSSISTPVLITREDCYIRYSPEVSKGTLVNHSSGSNAAVLRAHSGDVIRLADVNPVIGGEYVSNGVVRNDWYRVHYYGYSCYVTADSFDVAFYHAPSNRIIELVAPSDVQRYGHWNTLDNPNDALTLKIN